jgi:hypothetical protein
MRYILLIHGNEKAEGTMTKEAMGEMFAAYGAYTQALRDAGAYLGGDALQPTLTASTVRGTKVLHGPFAETQEQLGGFYLIEAADLDAAIAWAKKCPGAQHGSVEVRPIMSVPATV